MHLSLRSLAAAAALLVMLPPAALAGVAGGPHLKITGQSEDGRTYRVHAYMCPDPGSAKVTAWAEGLVNGQRETMPLKVRRTSEPRLFTIERAWPTEGRWAIRMKIANQPDAGVTVTLLDEHGHGNGGRVVFDGDGMVLLEDALAGKLSNDIAASGPHLKVAGQSDDGRTFWVQAYLCPDPALAKVTAWAEGLVNGQRETIPLEVVRTTEPRTFTIERTWPTEGRWVIRMFISNQPEAGVTLTRLDEKGRGNGGRVVFDGDGLQLLEDVLAGKVSDDGC
jgi:hypothetical protein